MSQVPATRVQGNSKNLDYTPPSTAVTGGDVLVVGSIPFIATSDIAVGRKGALSSDGLFNVPKDASVFSACDAVYWNATGNPNGGTAGTGCATSTVSGNVLMGFVPPGSSALTGDPTVQTALSAAKRTTTLGGAVVADSLTGDTSSLAIGGLAAAQGGAVALAGGTSSTSANAGGAVSLVGGTPGATGVGGAVSVAGAAGGATSGAGGAASFLGGAGTTNAAGGAYTAGGGAGQGTGAGGAATSKGGASGAGATGNGGSYTSGGGAALSTNGSGGAGSYTGGAATGTGTGGALTLAGGASGGASGTAGSAAIDAGAATGGTGATVNIGDANATAVYVGRGPLKSIIFGSTTAALGTTQNSTPTAAQLLGGLVTQTGATGAGTVTTPTGTVLSAAMPRAAVTGDTFDCIFANLGGSQNLVITAGASGITVIGNATVPSGKIALLTFVNTGANTWLCYVFISA